MSAGAVILGSLTASLEPTNPTNRLRGRPDSRLHGRHSHTWVQGAGMRKVVPPRSELIGCGCRSLAVNAGLSSGSMPGFPVMEIYV